MEKIKKAKKVKKRLVNFHLEEDVNNELKVLSMILRVSKAQLVRDAISNHLNTCRDEFNDTQMMMFNLHMSEGFDMCEL